MILRGQSVNLVGAPHTMSGSLRKGYPELRYKILIGEQNKLPENLGMSGSSYRDL